MHFENNMQWGIYAILAILFTGFSDLFRKLGSDLKILSSEASFFKLAHFPQRLSCIFYSQEKLCMTQRELLLHSLVESLSPYSLRYLLRPYLLGQAHRLYFPH